MCLRSDCKNVKSFRSYQRSRCRRGKGKDHKKGFEKNHLYVQTDHRHCCLPFPSLFIILQTYQHLRAQRNRPEKLFPRFPLNRRLTHANAYYFLSFSFFFFSSYLHLQGTRQTRLLMALLENPDRLNLPSQKKKKKKKKKQGKKKEFYATVSFRST